jgi:pimeloyl-ACP methyl ester carboxylesterase
MSLAASLALFAGCQSQMTCPRVIFLDGAGWYTGDGPVRAGLREAGYQGVVERFGWSSMLGPMPDHLLAGKGHPKVVDLARRIIDLRRSNPDGQIIVMGLSAGTSLVVHALEKLPPDVAVDEVVLLSPSVSNRQDLSYAMKHVKGRLYATSSPYDDILATFFSAGLEGGRPAGQTGFVVPMDIPEERRRRYDRVYNLRWRPEYAAYGWTGDHVNVTSREFISKVIAPRVLDDQPYPLDRPITANLVRG